LLKIQRNMSTVSILQEAKKEVIIPKQLVYEELNGCKLYRKGYKDVINQTKTIEEIMGCSSLQGIIISVFLSYLYRNIEDEGYAIITNEIGLHVSLGNNLSSDIILYDAQDAIKYQFNEHYFNVAPKMVIEVDVKIDLVNISDVDYIADKTQTLFGFGVERVIWVFTTKRKVILAQPNQDWIIRDWAKDFDIIDGHAINLMAMIEKKGYKI
jgi:Uma2 family endonuclease